MRQNKVARIAHEHHPGHQRHRLGHAFPAWCLQPAVLRLLGQRNWHANLSVPLLLEYEEICKRIMPPLGISINAIDEFLDYLCSVCEHRRIFYLWRPELPDADDDFLLELAIEAGAEFIISFNKKDFPETEKFGIRVLTPREFLQLTGDWP